MSECVRNAVFDFAEATCGFAGAVEPEEPKILLKNDVTLETDWPIPDEPSGCGGRAGACAFAVVFAPPDMAVFQAGGSTARTAGAAVL